MDCREIGPSAHQREGTHHFLSHAAGNPMGQDPCPRLPDSSLRSAGSYATCQKLEKKLGVKEGHVREDGEYSIEFMECLADCGEGPVVMVDEETYENIDEEKAEKLADLMLKGKLDQSTEFVSYEKGLLSDSPVKTKTSSSKAKK